MNSEALYYISSGTDVGKIVREGTTNSNYTTLIQDYTKLLWKNTDNKIRYGDLNTMAVSSTGSGTILDIPSTLTISSSSPSAGQTIAFTLTSYNGVATSAPTLVMPAATTIPNNLLKLSGSNLIETYDGARDVIADYTRLLYTENAATGKAILRNNVNTMSGGANLFSDVTKVLLQSGNAITDNGTPTTVIHDVNMIAYYNTKLQYGSISNMGGGTEITLTGSGDYYYSGTQIAISIVGGTYYTRNVSCICSFNFTSTGSYL